MPKQKRSHPFGSALLGGAVVAVFGLFALATGLVSTGGGSTTTREVVAASGTTPAAAVTSGESTNTVNAIYKADANGVAFIESKEAEGIASGSGVVLDDEGHVLTNNHVVEGGEEIRVSFESEGKMYPAEVVGTEPNSDLALLKVDAPASQLHPLKLGDSSKMEVGDPVVAIGNPFDLQRTVTSGIVSALQREIQAPDGVTIDHVIQTDAAINPGNSGGPLINSAGEVIGINSQIATGGEGSDGSVGIGFAIPIDTAKEEIAKLESGTAAEHGYLGLSGASITPELAQALQPAGRRRGARAAGHRRRPGGRSRDPGRDHRGDRRRQRIRPRRRHHHRGERRIDRLGRRPDRKDRERPRRRNGRS